MQRLTPRMIIKSKYPALLADASLVEVLCELSMKLQTYDSRGLWNVLTTLRGPDNEIELVKLATTGLVRKCLFGDRAIRPYDEQGTLIGPGGCVYPATDKAEYVELRKSLELNHFVTHGKMAFKALGLEWDKLNTFEAEE